MSSNVNTESISALLEGEYNFRILFKPDIFNTTITRDNYVVVTYSDLLFRELAKITVPKKYFLELVENKLLRYGITPVVKLHDGLTLRFKNYEVRCRVAAKKKTYGDKIMFVVVYNVKVEKCSEKVLNE